MLLAEVLDSGQVAAVVVGGDQQLLLLDPGLLVGDVAEELVQGVGLTEERLPVGGQVLDVLVPHADILLLVADVDGVELARVLQLVHAVDPVLVRDDVGLNQLLVEQLKGLEGAGPGVYLGPMLLVLLQQRLCPSHVRGKLVRAESADQKYLM